MMGAFNFRPNERKAKSQMSFQFESLLVPPGLNMPCSHQHEAEPATVHNKDPQITVEMTVHRTYPLQILFQRNGFLSAFG